MSEIGALLCSELMATDDRPTIWGRPAPSSSRVPRATGDHQRWQIASQMAAIASGAFVLTSNRERSVGRRIGDDSAADR